MLRCLVKRAKRPPGAPQRHRIRLQKSLAALNQMVTQPPQYESDHFNTLKKTVEQKLGMYQHQLNLFLTLTAAGNKKDAARLMDAPVGLTFYQG